MLYGAVETLREQWGGRLRNIAYTTLRISGAHEITNLLHVNNLGLYKYFAHLHIKPTSSKIDVQGATQNGADGILGHYSPIPQPPALLVNWYNDGCVLVYLALSGSLGFSVSPYCFIIALNVPATTRHYVSG